MLIALIPSIDPFIGLIPCPAAGPTRFKQNTANITWYSRVCSTPRLDNSGLSLDNGRVFIGPRFLIGSGA